MSALSKLEGRSEPFGGHAVKRFFSEACDSEKIRAFASNAGLSFFIVSARPLIIGACAPDLSVLTAHDVVLLRGFSWEYISKVGAGAVLLLSKGAKLREKVFCKSQSDLVDG